MDEQPPHLDDAQLDDEKRPAVWLVALAALLCVPGLWLRFTDLEWMDFSGDELAILGFSYSAAHEEFAPHGIPASIGVPLPNFLFYLLALPVTLTRDPVAIVRFVAALNVAGLGLLFLLLRRPLGIVAALCATAVFASLPWAVVFARKLWNPDFLFPFATLLYLLLASQMQRPRSWKCAAAVVVYVVLCGFHASAWIMIVPIALWVVLFRVRLEWRGIALGLGVGLVLLAPYVYHFIASDFDDFRLASIVRRGAPAPSESIPAAFARHARLSVEASTGAGFDGAEPGDSSLDRASAIVSRGFLAWTALACAIAWLRVPLLAWRARRGVPLSPFDALLSLGALIHAVILAAYAYGRFLSLSHYYAILLPMPTLWAVWLAVRVLGAASPARHLRIVLASALVVAAHTVLVVRFLEGVREGRPGTAAGTPFAPRADHWRAEVERLFAAIDDGRAIERAQQSRNAQLFEASSDVVMRFDAARNEPPAIAFGTLDIEARADGLVVGGSTALNMLRLPEFALEGRGRAIVELELRVPKKLIGCVFYTTEEAPNYGGNRWVEMRLKPGENRVYLEIPAPTAAGRLMVRIYAATWVLRSAEIRRVE